MSKELTIDRKYELYEAAVQAPDYDVDFFQREYKKYSGNKKSITFREDFCGTGQLSCAWVKENKNYKAIGLDLDPEPVDYGKKVHLAALSKSEQKRMSYQMCDVMKSKKYKADIVAALNFSYCIFQERSILKKYFAQVKASLNKNGLFFLDLFGGTDCMGPIEDIIQHEKFSYYWDCDEFNPINNHCIYKIHFKEKGMRNKYKDVFVYDWRMWSLAEIQDLLKEVGFKDVIIYWEEDDNDGGGNGVYRPATKADNCQAWVVYILAIP